MVSQKKMTKKLLAVVLSILMVLSAIPVGIFTTVFAASPECMAVEVDGVKIYFYGVDTLEVDENTVKYTGGDGNTPTLYVDGNSEIAIDAEDVVAEDNSITFKSEWLEAQTEWIAIQCDEEIAVPSVEPSVDVDKTAPQVEVTGNIEAWTNEDVTLTVVATDEETGVVSYSKDKVNWTTEESFTVSENGDYYFYAKDAVGNISDAQMVTVSYIDKTDPEISSITIDPDSWTNKSITMVVNAADNESGLADKAYRIDDGDWQESNEFTVNDSDTHTFYALDNAGNITSKTQSADRHDVVKPIITDVEVKYGEITIDSTTFTSPKENYDFYITATDDKSGVAKYSCDGTNWQTTNKFTLNGGDSYTFYVMDNAENISEVKEYSLPEDTTAPLINSIERSTSDPTNKPVTITIDAIDNANGSGLNDNAYALDDDTNWQNVATFTIKDSKPHTVYVRDSAVPVNVSSQEITIDNYCDETPTIEEVTLSTQEWTNSTIIATVNATGTKNAAGTYFEIAQYKMDDGDWQPESTFEINDCKEHKFYVKDTAENPSEAFSKTAVNYDGNLPVLEDGVAVNFSQENIGIFASIANKLTFGRYFNKALKISVAAKDVAIENESNASGIISATFKFADAKSNVYEFDAKEIGNSTECKITFDVKENDLPNDFKGTAEIVLVDKAGNVNTIPVTTGNSDMGLLEGDASDFNFMIENTAPTVDSIVPTATPVDNVYKSDYTVTFTISDKTEKVENSGIARAKIEANETIISEIDYQDKFTDNEVISVTTNAEEKKINGVEIKDWNKGEIEYVITIVDNAGNETSDSRTYKFDQTAPQITGFSFDKADDRYYKDTKKFENIYEAVSVEEYGFYFKNTVEVTVTAKDIKNTDEACASGLKSISVYLEDIDGTIYIVPENNSEIKKTDKNSLSEIVAVPTTDKLTFTIPQDFKGQIYAYATDNVDNSPVSCRFVLDNDVNEEGFVHPDGSIVETTDKHYETSSIEFTSVPKAQGTQNNDYTYPYKGSAKEDKNMDYDVKQNVPLYNKNVKFGVKVEDSYSGIREVRYTIIEGKTKTVKTVVIDNNGYFTGDAFGWSITKSSNNLAVEMKNTIAVSGNYNNMVLLIELTDRAGNKSYDYYVFGIDKTAPSITVTYSNNNADAKSGDGSYFQEGRVATILVQERNFNTENVKFTIKNAEGDIPNVIDKGIVTKDKNGNGDGNIYKYEIRYKAEGVYKFNVEYTDRATNKATVDYKDSVAPRSFIIDKTNPSLKVSFDPNVATNSTKYFDQNRTATITVVEHNFDPDRVEIFVNGQDVHNSARWIEGGAADTYITTVKFDSDGDYTFSARMTDKAGRHESEQADSDKYGANYEVAKEFTVDTTYSDIVKVEGVENGDVFGLGDNGIVNDEAKISIVFNDVNFDKYSIHLYRNRVLVDGISANNATDDKFDKSDVITTKAKNTVENDVEVTEMFIGNASSGNANTTVTFDIPRVDENNVRNDGIYTLKIEASDKAGNAYNTEANVKTFSVNRFGSVYTVDKDLYNLLDTNDGYTQALNGEIVIREYNTTEITPNELEIYKGNTALSDVDCKPTKAPQTGVKWHEYVYKVDKKYFMDGDKYNDGEYSIVISSRDKAKKESTNDKYDACKVDFVIDTTAPKISGILTSVPAKDVGFKENYREINSSEDVTITVPVTDNLRLSKIEVWVGDISDSAAPTCTYVYSGDKLELIGEPDGTFDKQTRFDDCSFTLEPENASQSFRVRVTDKVGLTIDTADFASGKATPDFDGFFNEVLITPNVFVRMWNRPAVKIALGAGVLAVAMSAVLIVVKKSKKNDEAE